jgi:hypothetical protein
VPGCDSRYRRHLDELFALSAGNVRDMSLMSAALCVCPSHQDLHAIRVQLSVLAPPCGPLGVFHGVHYIFLVDTIVGAPMANLKMGWPDACGSVHPAA